MEITLAKEVILYGCVHVYRKYPDTCIYNPVNYSIHCMCVHKILQYTCIYIIVHNVCRDGGSVSDDEIVGMLIGFLLAGQHTSSTTSAWLGFFLARHKELQVYICMSSLNYMYII